MYRIFLIFTNSLMKMTSVLLFILFLWAPMLSQSQNFEGVMKFVVESQLDTTFIHFYFKDAKIKIDKFEHINSLSETYLIDIKAKRKVALNHQKKLFKDMRLIGRSLNKNDCVVKKTLNSKLILNFECKQWRVKNEEIGSELTTYVLKKHFSQTNKQGKSITSSRIFEGRLGRNDLRQGKNSQKWTFAINDKMSLVYIPMVLL